MQIIKERIIPLSPHFSLSPVVTSIHSLEGEQRSATLRLEDLLVFVTGADRIPPLGFNDVAEVRFLHGETKKLPIASTCAPAISLTYNVPGI